LPTGRSHFFAEPPGTTAIQPVYGWTG